MNQVILVGRLKDDPKVEQIDDDRRLTTITLLIQRNFKDINGEYQTDEIPCEIWNYFSTTVAEYCRKGDMVGVRGRVEKVNDKDIAVIAEKVTFLSSKGEKENEI